MDYESTALTAELRALNGLSTLKIIAHRQSCQLFYPEKLEKQVKSVVVPVPYCWIKEAPIDQTLKSIESHYKLFSHKAYKLARMIKRLRRIWIYSEMHNLDLPKA